MLSSQDGGGGGGGEDLHARGSVCRGHVTERLGMSGGGGRERERERSFIDNQEVSEGR